MNDPNTRPLTERRMNDRKRPRSKKQKVQSRDWEREDERLDDALRQTFPASDALSIVQNVRGR
jgi:hypothetical protein